MGCIFVAKPKITLNMCSIDLVQLAIAIAASLTAAFTYLIYWIARKELRMSNKVSSQEFQNKIKNDFYTDSMYKLFFLIENDLLEFNEQNDKTNYFKVKPSSTIPPLSDIIDKILDNFNIDRSSRIMPNYLIDHYLLNHFTDIEKLRTENIFSWQDIYDGFSYYIVGTYENNAIRQYVEFSRKGEECEDVFQEFIDLYKLFKSPKN